MSATISWPQEIEKLHERLDGRKHTWKPSINFPKMWKICTKCGMYKRSWVNENGMKYQRTGTGDWCEYQPCKLA